MYFNRVLIVLRTDFFSWLLGPKGVNPGSRSDQDASPTRTGPGGDSSGSGHVRRN